MGIHNSKCKKRIKSLPQIKIKSYPPKICMIISMSKLRRINGLKIKLLIDILPLDLINYIGIIIYQLHCGKNTIYNISNIEIDMNMYDISIISDNDIEKLFMTIIDNVMCLKYNDKKIDKNNI